MTVSWGLDLESRDNCVSTSGIFLFLPSCPPSWSSNSLLTLTVIIIKHVPGLRAGREGTALDWIVVSSVSPLPATVCRGRLGLHLDVGVYLEWLAKSVENIIISQGWKEAVWRVLVRYQYLAANGGHTSSVSSPHTAPAPLPALNTVNTPNQPPARLLSVSRRNNENTNI